MAAAPALPAPFLARGFAWYVSRLAGRHFASVRWRIPEEGARWGEDPLLIVANHTNWWDGFLAHQVTRALGLQFQILMDAKGVDTYPVFRRLGAVPVRRSSVTGSVADLAAVAPNLRPGVALWVFPQGERRPAGAPVSGCEHGASWLALGAGRPVRIVPVGFRYPFLSEQLPEAFVLAGESWTVGGCGQGADLRAARRTLTAEIERRLNAALAQLDACLAAESVSGFPVLVRGRLSINKRMDRARHAAGLLEGPFQRRNG